MSWSTEQADRSICRCGVQCTCSMNSVHCDSLQILSEGEFADSGFKLEWNSDPQLMGVYSLILIVYAVTSPAIRPVSNFPIRFSA